MDGIEGRPLRVCLDARLESGVSGGTEQVVIGMASGLSQLTEGDEEYLFLASRGRDAWITPYIGGNCKLLDAPSVQSPKNRAVLDRIPGCRAAWDQFSPILFGAMSFKGPVSDGTIENAGVDVMHFLLQRGFITSVPTIYHPHDLQHIHLAEFFTPRARMGRDILFRTLCQQAATVSVTATWGKQDLVRQYGLPEAKVQVVPLAPSNEAYPVPAEKDLASVRAKYSLQDPFVFYPAQTFPHKNHLALLDALALLRDRKGLVIPFVSSGRCNSFYPRIEKHIKELRLGSQVQFLGFVSPLELQCLYRLCRCVVIPTRFEAASFPVWDAFLAGTPVACSNVTSLPQQVGDAALVFDPEDTQAIANAIERLWTDQTLCRELIERGRTNVARFSWNRTARQFRAHYRRIAGRPMSDEDRRLLQAPPLL